MLNFIMAGGPFMWILVIIALANLYLAIKNSIILFKSSVEPSLQLTNSINAILFWGCTSAVIGVLAQFMGIYQALGAIIKAADISPQIVMMGFRISFNTTLAGLTILAISAIYWFALKSRYIALLERK